MNPISNWDMLKNIAFNEGVYFKGKRPRWTDSVLGWHRMQQMLRMVKATYEHPAQPQYSDDLNVAMRVREMYEEASRAIYNTVGGQVQCSIEGIYDTLMGHSDLYRFLISNLCKELPRETIMKKLAGRNFELTPMESWMRKMDLSEQVKRGSFILSTMSWIRGTEGEKAAKQVAKTLNDCDDELCVYDHRVDPSDVVGCDNLMNKEYWIERVRGCGELANRYADLYYNTYWKRAV